jgi:hypothetical protein
VLAAYVPSIWSQLYRHTECEEEGTRNVVAECLGKLCLIRPEELLPKLQVRTVKTRGNLLNLWIPLMFKKKQSHMLIFWPPSYAKSKLLNIILFPYQG